MTVLSEIGEYDLLRCCGKLKNWLNLKPNLMPTVRSLMEQPKRGRRLMIDVMKKQSRPFFSQFFSPIFLKAFSITFFGEWGDKSQLATIRLAADEDPFGAVLVGIVGQAFCTTAAALGGKSLASEISEKIVAHSGGILFIVFGIQSYLSSVES